MSHEDNIKEVHDQHPQPWVVQTAIVDGQAHAGIADGNRKVISFSTLRLYLQNLLAYAKELQHEITNNKVRITNQEVRISRHEKLAALYKRALSNAFAAGFSMKEPNLKRNINALEKELK